MTRLITGKPMDDQIPELSAASMDRWNSWFDARLESKSKALVVTEWNEWCHETVSEMLGGICEVIGDATGKAENELRKEIRKEFADEIAKMKRDFATKLTKMRKEVSARSSNVVDLPNPLARKA